jgi:hypothetical protein
VLIDFRWRESIGWFDARQCRLLTEGDLIRPVIVSCCWNDEICCPMAQPCLNEKPLVHELHFLLAPSQSGVKNKPTQPRRPQNPCLGLRAGGEMMHLVGSEHDEGVEGDELGTTKEERLRK